MNKIPWFVVILFFSTWLNGQSQRPKQFLVELNENKEGYTFIDAAPGKIHWKG